MWNGPRLELRQRYLQWDIFYVRGLARTQQFRMPRFRCWLLILRMTPKTRSSTEPWSLFLARLLRLRLSSMPTGGRRRTAWQNRFSRRLWAWTNHSLASWQFARAWRSLCRARLAAASRASAFPRAQSIQAAANQLSLAK